MKTFLLSLALIAAMAAPAAAECISPTALGAVAGDGASDTTQIQALLNNPAVQCVLFDGLFEIARPAGRSESVLVGNDKLLRGEGPGTGLLMIGSALAPNGGRSWSGLRFKGFRSTASDFGVYVASTVVETDEQLHAIEVVGPSGAITLERLHVTNPTRYRPDGTVWPGGDCVRAIGESGGVGVLPKPIMGLAVRGLHLLNCDRSGFAGQRQLWALQFADNTCYVVGDQCFDAELTGDGMGGGWLVTGNTSQGGAQGNYDFAFESRTGYIDDVIFANNLMRGRGLYARNVRGLVVNGVLIRANAVNPDATLALSKTVEDAVITGSLVHRASGTPGPTVGILDAGTGYARRVLMSANLVRQDVMGLPNQMGNALRLRGVHELSFMGNRVATSNTNKAVSVAAVVVDESSNGQADQLVDLSTFFGGWFGFAAGGLTHTLTTAAGDNRMTE